MSLANSKDVKSPSEAKKLQKHHEIHYPLWFGGSASCLAVVLTHPLDLIKVRMQGAKKSPIKLGTIGTAKDVIRSDGFGGLYRGLTAGFARQLIYGTTRFAIYDEVKNRMASNDPSLPALIAASSVSGFLAGIVGNPADLANIRMQADTTLPAAERRNYRNVLDAWRNMYKEAGAASFFRGVWPNSTRAAIMTASQLAAYDAFKKALVAKLGMSDNLITHFTASTLAGLVATTLCSPVDVIKTQIMKSSVHHSIPVLIKDNFAADGPKWMLRGWVPSFTRLGPQTIATFMILEQHRKVYRWVNGLD